MGLPGACRPKTQGPVSTLVLASGLLLVGPCAARADELEKLLRRPLSPGSIALLASHTLEKGVVERLRAALTSPEPEVRGVAARVINLGGVTELLSDVQATLTEESDPDAAREEVRSLCSLGGP
ncbi:MAG TPA: hypothetical protein VLO07_04255, partial [Thermoanaerobaculia bacterium]|nr:hypothetical protein [Thermoanaerobaculia bacterium]